MRLWVRNYFGHNVDLEVVFFKTTTLQSFFEMLDPDQKKTYYKGSRNLNNLGKHLTLLELGAEDGDGIWFHDRSNSCFFLDDWMVLTLQKGSSTQQVCITKTTTVKKFFSLVDSHKIYDYWFEHWNLNLEDYEDFYLSQLGIKNGSLIECDEVNEEVFSEDFLKNKNIAKKSTPASSSGWGEIKVESKDHGWNIVTSESDSASDVTMGFDDLFDDSDDESVVITTGLLV